MNLVTGLLGTGKTSALCHLLRQVPVGERWAVVVNEFGELGIDAGVLAGGVSAAHRDTQVAIREVPGGCLCCTAQAGLRVALTQILRTVRPDRVLIEPSGVGHPTGIIDILREPPLAWALYVQAVICLLDPRQYTAQRLASSQVFVDQLALADVLVVNKADLAHADQRTAVLRAAQALYPPKQAVVVTTHGVIDPALLDMPATALACTPAPPRPGEHRRVGARHPHHAGDSNEQRTAAPGLGSRVTRWEAGYLAVGWYGGPERIFQRRRLQGLFALLTGAARFGLPPVLRAKGVLRTGRDWQLLNWAGDALELHPLAWRRDNRLELILQVSPDDTGGDPDWTAFEQALRDCRVPERRRR